MIKYFKYLSSFNLLALFDHLFKNVAGDGSGRFDTDRGLGSTYKWIHLKASFDEAQKTGKPIFLIIHRPWCPACQQLKPKVKKSVMMQNLSNHFVMVNVENGAGTLVDEPKYQPDGKYVPRILFFASSGDFIKDAYNRHPTADQKHKYFYSSPVQIAETMIFVLDNYAKGTKTTSFIDKCSTLDCPVDISDTDRNASGPTILE